MKTYKVLLVSKTNRLDGTNFLTPSRECEEEFRKQEYALELMKNIQDNITIPKGYRLSVVTINKEV